MSAEKPTTCATCGALLNPSGLCNRCLFLDFDESEAAPGFSIPGLEDLEEIARGGMGIVYKAREKATGRIVAVKLPATRMWEDAEVMRRFSQEVRSAALLDHPHVLPVYEVGRTSDAPFFTMKYAGGGSLAEQSKARRANDGFHRWTADVLAKVADAVQFAHEHGVLHRDLKPANVLFDEAGEPYVGDFGLAKWLEGSLLGEATNLTRTITSLGTPHYLAPEIGAGKPNAVSVASDVYALGAILYEMLCGRPPHEGGSLTLLLRQVADESPDAPSKLARANDIAVPPADLEAICLKAMQREPQDRYPSAAALAADLRRFISGESVSARPLPMLQKMTRWSRRHPAMATMAAALVIVLAASATMIVRKNRELSRALDTAGASLQQSLIAQSRLVRQDSHLGQRTRALELVRKAAAMGVTPELRNEAAAVLAEPDMVLAGELFRFKPTGYGGAAAAVTPDFRLQLSRAEDGSVALREIGSGKAVWSYGESAGLLASAFQLSDDGKFAALSDLNHRVEVWDTATNRRLLATQLVHPADQSAFHQPARPFHLHAKLPLAAGADAARHVWLHRLDTGEQKEVVTDRQEITAVRINEAGTEIAVVSGRSVVIYPISGGKGRIVGRVRDGGNAIAWRGEVLLAVDRQTDEVVVMDSGDVRTHFSQHHSTPLMVGLFRNTRLAVSTSNRGRTWMWDSRDGRPLWQMETGTALLCTHESNKSLIVEGAPGRAVKWERVPDRVFTEMATVRSFEQYATGAVRMSGDGKLAVSFSNAYIFLWDLANRRFGGARSLKGGKAGVSGDFSPDSRAFFCSRPDSEAVERVEIVWTAGKAGFGDVTTVPGSAGMSIDEITADGDWRLHGAAPRSWKPDQAGAPVALVSGVDGMGCIVSADGRFAVRERFRAGENGVLDAKTGKGIARLTADADGVQWFSENDTWLVAATADEVRFIDTATWTERGRWPSSGRIGTGALPRVTVSADGKMAAIEQPDDVIDLIALPECWLHLKLEPPQVFGLVDFQFTPDGGRLCVIGADQRLFQWDLRALEEELAKLGLGQ